MQRDSFDVIGKVGFGRDFGASRDIDNTVNNTFRLVTNDFEENMRRAVFPLRKYSRSKVTLIDPLGEFTALCLTAQLCTVLKTAEHPCRNKGL